MDLVLQSIKYMLWLNGAMIVGAIGLAIGYNSPEAIAVSLQIGLVTLILLAFRTGLRKEKRWVALLFAAFCTIDLFGAISGGISLRNAINLVDGILSFVAICGVIIWLRERSITASQSKA
ncbi:hypothetical protein [Ruegeria arenilitoris]|uniref:hypothetical protein n=1 Tax=Ruegeria arenilitoris TaxID=1173585 RepID=UPI001479BD83|nr:hypothetical protein [Ruegeria arenilitoris]